MSDDRVRVGREMLMCPIRESTSVLGLGLEEVFVRVKVKVKVRFRVRFRSFFHGNESCSGIRVLGC